MLVDDLNPVAMHKQKEDITFLGSQGRSKESMSVDTRASHSSGIGIISEATKDSGDVGISSYLSANPEIDNIRGIISDVNINKIGWDSILSTSAMLAPFGTMDDPKRLDKIGPGAWKRVLYNSSNNGELSI